MKKSDMVKDKTVNGNGDKQRWSLNNVIRLSDIILILGIGLAIAGMFFTTKANSNAIEEMVRKDVYEIQQENLASQILRLENATDRLSDELKKFREAQFSNRK